MWEEFDDGRINFCHCCFEFREEMRGGGGTVINIPERVETQQVVLTERFRQSPQVEGRSHSPPVAMASLDSSPSCSCIVQNVYSEWKALDSLGKL